MSIFGFLRPNRSSALLQELASLSHPQRVERLIALGRAARKDEKAAALLEDLWNAPGDGSAYARRLVLKSCFGSRDGARVLQALSDPSRLLRGGARKLVALCCDDKQTLSALQTMWYVRQHLPILQALRKRGRTAPVDAFLDWLATQPGDTRLVDCVPYGSEAGITRHFAAALLRPSYRFFDAMLIYAPKLLARHITAELRKGQGKPDAQLMWLVRRSLLRMSSRVPIEACALCDALLTRGEQPDAAVWPMLVRHAAPEAAELAAGHTISLPFGLFEKSARHLGEQRLSALLRKHCFALGNPKEWLRFLPESDRRPVIAAYLEAAKQHPSFGAAMLRELSRDSELGKEDVLEDAYARWSPAAQNVEGIIDRQLIKQLPPELALREAHRHLHTVTALKTRPRDRLPYASFLDWEEASQILKAYIGHPEGETRGHALAVLLELAGRAAPERRPALVVESLRMVKARKNEQDPVRLAMLQALVAWPREAWLATNLPDVAQILRDALDAADLSHATAHACERLVVRLFRIDGAWGGKWLATLIKERGTIYQPRLGDQLRDDDVRAVAPALLEVAKAWAVREREGHLVQLAASLEKRITLVPGLVDVLVRVLQDTSTAGSALSLMALLGEHDRPRFLAILEETCNRWLQRTWDGPLVSLAQAQKRGEVPPALCAALEAALFRTIYESQAAAILNVLRQRAGDEFKRIVPRAVAKDVSFICLHPVSEFLHRKRQDLLAPCLGTEIIRGRFATGKTRWMLPFFDGFFRWTPEQQVLFAEQLGHMTDDADRDTPTIFSAIVRLPRLQFMMPKKLIALADDKRPAVLEKAVRTLGRCDAGQGVDKLLVCLEDSRARFAIYSLRRAVLELPPQPALALLQKVPMNKVTVAKEVVRLLGELRSEPAFAALLGLDSPTLHRDIRIALIRALWDHLERNETWQFLERAATGSDWILATRVGDIPPDRLTSEVDRRLAQVMALVLGRPEPEARIELLRRAPGLPMKDRERSFLAACLARLDSRFTDEVQAALYAVLGRAHESDLAKVAQALVAMRKNRRAIDFVASLILQNLPPKSQMTARIGEALVQALATDDHAVPLYLRCALRIHSEPLAVARCVAILREVAQRGRLDGAALAAARDALRVLPVARIPIEQLEDFEAQLHNRDDPQLRLLALDVLTTIASPQNGQGWTPVRRARLQAFTQDAAPIVASAAEFIFPPAEEPPTTAS